MGDFKKLEVWQRAMKLTFSLHAVTKSFPNSERFGLVDQIRRAASSIPANIAEGCGRNGDRELIRFLNISLGSANELESHLIRAAGLSLLERKQADPLIGEVTRIRGMLASLIRYLRATSTKR